MTKKGEKKAKAAKKPEERTNLPWNDEMVVALLKVVYDTKTHLQSGNKGVSMYWSNVTIKFFDQPDCIIFKEKHLFIDPESKLADYRKLKDKYNKTLESVQMDIEKGNQSGKEGDLSPLYKLVQLINSEIDAQDEVKATAKETALLDKTQLAQNESTVLGANGKKRNANTAIRVRAADGTITVDEEREKNRQKKTSNGLDDYLIKMLKDKYDSPNETASSALPSRAEKVLALLTVYVDSNAYCSESFIRLAYQVTKAPPPEDLYLSVQLLGGLEMLLSLYCEGNFSATVFCQHMKEMNIEAIPARIMHLLFEKWRKVVEAPIPNNISVLSTTSSSNNVSALTSGEHTKDNSPQYATTSFVLHNGSSENAIGSSNDDHVQQQRASTWQILQELDTALCSHVVDFELPPTAAHYGP